MSKLIVFTAPSGSGKTTVVRHLLNTFEQLAFSISATTRDIRPHEKDGKDYYFLSHKAFKQKIKEDAFIEWEEVYENQFYGTLKSEVDRISKLGKYIIFDVEVKGATSIKQFYGDEALVVFIRPPSLEVLIERLKNRKTETTKSLKKRIKRAKEELKYENNFDMILVNDILEVTLKEAELIVEDFLHIQEKENEASL